MFTQVSVVGALLYENATTIPPFGPPDRLAEASRHGEMSFTGCGGAIVLRQIKFTLGYSIR